MKKLYLIWILILIPLVSSALIYEARQEVDIKIPCINNGTACSNAQCNITVNYPNGSMLVNGANMSNLGSGIFNYTLTNNNVIGDYSYVMTCNDNGELGYDVDEFSITNTGTEPNESQSIMYLGLLIVTSIFLILSIYGGFTVNNIFIKTGLFLLSYIFVMILSFVSWRIALDFLNSSMFIAIMNLWFKIMMIGFPFLVIYLVIMLTVEVVRNKELLALAKRGLK